MDAETTHDAKELAKALNWGCTNREIVLKDARLSFNGPGTVQILDKSDSHIEVKGEVRLRMPERVAVEEVFDTELFRHLVAVEGGRFPNPPTSKMRDLKADESDVPGLKCVGNFLTEIEEEDLVKTIDRCEWRSDIKRRVQHYPDFRNSAPKRS